MAERCDDAAAHLYVLYMHSGYTSEQEQYTAYTAAEYITSQRKHLSISFIIWLNSKSISRE